MTAVPIVPLVDLRAEYRLIADEIQAAVGEVISSGEIVLGGAVARFEEEFAAYLGVSHAVGVGSGLDAIRLSLVAVGLRPGDEVILPANTFIATALAVSASGATPVLVDCRPDTCQIDVPAIQRAITPRTKAIIAVHLYGHPADMASILRLSREHSLAVIEDAAQAHGARLNGRPCGAIGDFGCFSFYPSKNLGAYGDAGLVVTPHAEMAARVRDLRDYGQRTKNVHLMKGFNSRLDTIQASVLRVKLRYLDHRNAQRRAHAARYQELLPLDHLTVPEVQPGATHVYHLFVVRSSERDRLRAYLEAQGVQTGIHYPTPIHLQPAYADLGLAVGAFPVAERLATESLSLPIYPELTEMQLQQVATAVRRFFGT
jgi:dTDP-4-amino-4,6-dideoxygalactose transaminase